MTREGEEEVRKGEGVGRMGESRRRREGENGWRKG